LFSSFTLSRYLLLFSVLHPPCSAISDSEPLADSLLDGDALSDSPDALGLTLSDSLADCDAEGLWLLDAEGLGDNDLLSLADGLSDADPEPDGEILALSLAEGLKDGDSLPSDADRLAEGEALFDSLAEGLALFDSDLLGDKLPLGLILELAEDDGDNDLLILELGESDAEGLRDFDSLADGEKLALIEELGLCDALGDKDLDSDPEGDKDLLADADGD